MLSDPQLAKDGNMSQVIAQVESPCLQSLHFSSSSNSVKSTSFAGIISQADCMQKVFRLLGKVAKTSSTVLVLGESGTGKELVARALHKLSGRSGRMVPVNCGAIPEEILESELFGHEKGAFTGATASRIGRFQLADKGTIFLDEIGEMSPKLQVKLLRVLQERTVEPVGSTRSIEVDVRVVAATNKDLWQEVQAGRFREDLYYRLQVVPVDLPALRERRGDVSLLAGHFLGQACERIGRPALQLSTAALVKLEKHHWNGNVRELENLCERLAVLSDGLTIEADDLPSNIGVGAAKMNAGLLHDLPLSGVDFNAMDDAYETSLITLALNKTQWNKKAAAELLGLNRTTLVEKVKKKQLSPEDGQEPVEAASAFCRNLPRLGNIPSALQGAAGQ